MVSVLDYKELSRIGQTVSIEGIKEKAKAICQTRKENAQPLNQAKEEVLSGLMGVEKSVSEIKECVGSFTEDKSLLEKITTTCDNLLNAIPEFRNSVRILCSRLNDGKIRIVSIGEKSQGKSLFTQLYTRIPEGSQILKVKPQNATEDCTGAVNTFHHKDGTTDPLIKVQFLKLEQVVNIIKSYISIIKTNTQYANWNIDGIDGVKTKDDLATIVQDESNLGKINGLKNVPSDVKNGLKQYFAHGTSYIDKLNKATDSISEDEISEYNDMQNTKAYYLAVDHIDITMDLHMQGLFEYFEVADTKGASLDAGYIANQNIFNVIEESDAVFSIAKANQTQTWAFYNDFLGSKYRGNKVFKDKHFAIVNLDANFNQSAAHTGIGVLDDQGLSKFCYVGRLVNDANTDDCIPEDFVKNLIVHMLDNIADSITEFDNERIRICCESGNIIRKSIEDLRVLTDEGHIKPWTFDEKQLVIDKIRDFCNNASRYIDDQIQLIDGKNDDYDDYDEDDDYKLYYKEVTKNEDSKRYASLYEVLTGEKYPGKFPASLDEDDDDKELSEAVEKIISTVKSNKEIKENMNTAVHVGEYVDNITTKTKDEIVHRLFERRIQHPISFTKREELFNKLWEIFYLDKIFTHSIVWDTECVERTDDLRRLNKVYNEGIIESFQSQDLMYNSFTILKEYFHLMQMEEEDGENRKISNRRLDDKLLHRTFEKEIKRLRIRESIIERIKTYPNAVRSFYNSALTEIDMINGRTNFIVDSFYLSHVDIIASEEDKKKLSLAKNWETFSSSLAKLRQYEFKNLPLIEIGNH